MLWLYVHFPSLQLDDLLNHHPEKRQQPVVVVNSQLNQVAQLNTAAEHEGIKVGMGIGAACALTEALQLVPFDDNTETALLESYAQCLYQHTADIALYPSKGLLLNVDKMLRLYGGLQNYWRLLEQQLTQFNTQYNAACGSTVNMAKVVATSGITLITDDYQQQRDALARLPVASLTLPEKVTTSFTRVGIGTIGSLLQIPLAELAQRFDKSVVNFMAEMLGDIPTKVCWVTPSVSFFQRLTLLYEILTTGVLSKPVSRLFMKLEHYLLRQDCSAYSIDLRFITRDESVIELNVCSAQAIYRASEWLALFELKVSKVTLSAPITIIELHVDDIEKNQGEVADLYQGQQGRLSHQQLASLLLNKLGEASVFHIKQGNSHEPEHASVYLPVDYSQRQSQKKREVLPSSSAIRFTERPSFLLSEPEKVYAPISVYHGPERIQTAWWRENAVNRDYFIGRNESGQWCWVYRQADNQWFIHGYFA